MHKAGHDASLQNVAPNQKHISTILDTNLSPIILPKNVNMAINRDSGGVFHLNKDRKISKLEKEKLLSAVGTPIPQHKQLVLGAQMNTSKEHFSPTNGEILPQNDGEIIHATKNNIKRLDRLKTRNSEILGNTSLDVSDRARRLPSHSDTSQTMPTTSSVGSTAGEILPQNADNFAQNLDQSAQNLPNANLNAPNLPNANFHNPRAEFSANNAYENFSNPNNPRFMSGGGGENPRFMPYSASQNPRANARGLEERTGFLNGEHLGAKEVALMNGSVDFTHLKKADFPPSSSANLAFENSQDVLTWRAANGANTARTNQSADEANLRARQEAHARAQQEAINEQEHLNANSLTNNTRADETNLGSADEANSRSANETNLSSADTTKTPKVKLTKEQNEAQKLLKQILKALKTSPTKKPFSISAGEKQTYKDAINEKLKELKEKEQILKEQPSANFGEIPRTLAQPNLNLNALKR